MIFVFVFSGKLIKDEVRGTEAVGLETYMAYVRSMGGISMALLVFFFFLLMFFTMTFNNWWLSYWLGQGSGVGISLYLLVVKVVTVIIMNRFGYGKY